MRTGTVKWFNPRKGYGFISPVDGGFDVYVHVSAVERAGMPELRQGQEIIFDVAVDVRTGEMFAENLSLAPEGKEETRGGEIQRVAASNAMSFIRRLTGNRASRLR